MLVELRIRNVAVIDTVVLPLAAGLNVLTGETGAGKSLIVGALGMLLGERAATDRIRSGADKATVEGVFEPGAMPSLRAMLDERGIDVDDETLVLKREIGTNGRSRAWINGSPVTATVLADVGARLVSVLGQHDSRQLGDVEHQRDVLDAFASALEARARVAEAYTALSALRRQERELEQRRQEAATRADLLRVVVREIEDAHPVTGEDVPDDRAAGDGAAWAARFVACRTPRSFRRSRGRLRPRWPAMIARRWLALPPCVVP